MEITDIRVTLRESPEKRFKAYATVTFDYGFVVRHIKIVEGKSGLFVAMPSQKPKVACGRCHFKNDLGGRFCAQCGSDLSRPMEPAGSGGVEGDESKTHRGIAHPITAGFRQYLDRKVLEAYEGEVAKTQRSSSMSAPVEHENE